MQSPQDLPASIVSKRFLRTRTNMKSRFTRRVFLKNTAAAAALSHTSGFALAPASAEKPSREVLQEFAYSDVKLNGGPLKEQYDQIHTHYLALDDDRLLKVYRERAGLPAPGKDMGGWYDLNGFVPGHTLGQNISGLARIGASTGDTACHAKVEALVKGFDATLGPDNQSILRPQTNQWICYTLDKHFVGLIDAFTLSNVSEGRELLNKVLAGSASLLPAKGRDRIGEKDPPYDETYVMPENLFAAYALTDNRAFRELALKYMLDTEYFDPLANGSNPLPGQHAYSHAIALSSAGKAYLVEGDPKHKRAMQNAFTLLTTQQQFASGGWGPNETFVEPHKGQLYDSLSTTVDHFETPCGSYAATKLARYLLRFTGDSRYGDNLERVVYNTILAVKPPDSDGDYPYYSTYRPRGTKVYYQKKWPCCSGTMVQTIADYVLNLYFRGNDGIYVNMYAPSEVSWKQNDSVVKLTQLATTSEEHATTLEVGTSKPSNFAIYLRIPSWAQGARITINDSPLTTTGELKGFFPIKRTWHDKDRIDLWLPQSFRTEAIDELHPKTAALMRGPTMYVALNPQVGQTRTRLSPGVLKQIAPQAYIANDSVFVPFYHVQNETYDTYFDIA
jgi:DUF1680 family protein